MYHHPPLPRLTPLASSRSRTPSQVEELRAEHARVLDESRDESYSATAELAQLRQDAADHKREADALRRKVRSMEEAAEREREARGAHAQNYLEELEAAYQEDLAARQAAEERVRVVEGQLRTAAKRSAALEARLDEVCVLASVLVMVWWQRGKPRVRLGWAFSITIFLSPLSLFIIQSCLFSLSSPTRNQLPTCSKVLSSEALLRDQLEQAEASRASLERARESSPTPEFTVVPIDAQPAAAEPSFAPGHDMFRELLLASAKAEAQASGVQAHYTTLRSDLARKTVLLDETTRALEAREAELAALKAGRGRGGGNSSGSDGSNNGNSAFGTEQELREVRADLAAAEEELVVTRELLNNLRDQDTVSGGLARSPDRSPTITSRPLVATLQRKLREIANSSDLSAILSTANGGASAGPSGGSSPDKSATARGLFAGLKGLKKDVGSGGGEASGGSMIVMDGGSEASAGSGTSSNASDDGNALATRAELLDDIAGLQQANDDLKEQMLKLLKVGDERSALKREVKALKKTNLAMERDMVELQARLELDRSRRASVASIPVDEDVVRLRERLDMQDTQIAEYKETLKRQMANAEDQIRRVHDELEAEQEKRRQYENELLALQFPTSVSDGDQSADGPHSIVGSGDGSVSAFDESLARHIDEAASAHSAIAARVGAMSGEEAKEELVSSITMLEKSHQLLRKKLAGLDVARHSEVAGLRANLTAAAKQIRAEMHARQELEEEVFAAKSELALLRGRLEHPSEMSLGDVAREAVAARNRAHSVHDDLVDQLRTVAGLSLADEADLTPDDLEERQHRLETAAHDLERSLAMLDDAHNIELAAYKRRLASRAGVRRRLDGPTGGAAPRGNGGEAAGEDEEILLDMAAVLELQAKYRREVDEYEEEIAHFEALADELSDSSQDSDADGAGDSGGAGGHQRTGDVVEFEIGALRECIAVFEKVRA